MTAAAAVPHRGMIVVSIMLATIMQALDTTIANVALPHMQGSLSATQEQISWVLTSYIVAAAIMTPPTGFLAARFGRKRLFLVAVACFTAASLLCGVAQTLPEMVAFRLLQGVFGAALVPLSQAVLLDTYPKEQHGSAMALWGLGVMVGPILGPTLGGYLTEVYNWRWVFLINLPFGIMAFLGILGFVPETTRDRERPFDFFGFAMLSLGIGALQLMLDRGETKGWFGSTEIVIEAAIAGLGLYLFIVQMTTAERPFLEPRLFKDRNLVVGLLFIFVVGIVLLATLALMPPFLQNLMLLGAAVITGRLVEPRPRRQLHARILFGHPPRRELRRLVGPRPHRHRRRRQRAVVLLRQRPHLVHGEVRIVPVALDAEAAELLALHVDPVFGELPALAPELDDGDGVLVLAGGAVLLLDLPFDRQAVAVPAWDVVGVLAQHLLRAIDHVLQDLVEGGADMDVTVGIGRAVMPSSRLQSSRS